MKRKIVVCGIIAIVGLAAGTGAGLLIGHSKAAKDKAVIADLQAKVQKAEAALQMRMQTADAESRRLNSELLQVKNELTQAKTTIEQSKNAGAQTAATTPAVNAEVKPGVPVAINNTMKNVATNDTHNIATTTYVVKDGDSLWGIAEGQLGNGYRYKEILKMNPSIGTGKNISVGTKLNIPAK